MSKLGKLNEPLALAATISVLQRIRAVKNEMRLHRKQGDTTKLQACEKALSELIELARLVDIEISHHIYAAQNILENRNRGQRVSRRDFEAVRHLIHATPERIEALRLVLVEGKTFQAAAGKFGWSRQAIHKTLPLFYGALEKRADEINKIYPPDKY